MELTIEAVKKRIAELERERDQYVSQVNQQIAAYAGAIQALQQLIAPDPPAAAPTSELTDQGA